MRLCYKLGAERNVSHRSATTVQARCRVCRLPGTAAPHGDIIASMIELPAGTPWEIVQPGACKPDDKSVLATDHESAEAFLRQFLPDFMMMSRLREILGQTDPVYLLNDDSVIDLLAWRLGSRQLVLKKVGGEEDEEGGFGGSASFDDSAGDPDAEDPPVEHLPYRGELARDAKAFAEYMGDIARGKALSQLKAVQDQLTPDLRKYWASQSFTKVITGAGKFDATVCSLSYHFHKHGQKYGNIRAYTEAARQYLVKNKKGARPDGRGLIKLPQGTYDKDGRIISFWG